MRLLAISLETCFPLLTLCLSDGWLTAGVFFSWLVTVTGDSGSCVVTGGPSPVTLSCFPMAYFSTDNRQLISWPRLKQWVQLAVPWVIHGLHFPFVVGLGGCTVLGGLAYVVSEWLATEVRAFSMVLAKAETCTVSSCRAVRCACTSACV